MAETKGSGSIIQLEKDKPKGKCRRWQLRVSVGRDPRTGRYKTKTRRFEGTYTQARAALRAFIDEIEDNHVQARTTYTLKAFCDHYLEQREQRREVAPMTLVRLRTQLRVACRLLGEARLEELTPTMINEAYAALMGGDSPSGRKLGGAYVSQIHTTLSLALDLAVREGLLVENPCDKANQPRVDTKPRKAASPEAVHVMVALLDESSPRDMAYMLAVTLGLRRGEICGLSWSDIDFENNIVDISHSLDNLGNLRQTKTKSGMRLLPLSEDLRDALLKYREAQRAQIAEINARKKKGEQPIVMGEDFPVITNAAGSRVSAYALTNWWRNDRAKFGMEGYTLHELRHTYLTLLALSGVHPKVMQELAGHHSSKITMDIYAHVNMDAKRKAMAAVSKVF